MRANRFALATVAVVLVCALTTTIVRSEDKPSDKPAANAMPTPQQMMEIMQKYGTPGPEHEKLKMMEGTFDADTTMQMAPDAPPMTSKGKMINKMVVDGRFLQGDYTGEMMGQPFKGLSLSGFNRYTKKIENVWLDSMSTGMMNSQGTLDDAGKMSLTCTFDCPITQSKRTNRQVLTINDANSHTLEMYDVGPDGKEFKSMTIKYTRAKEGA
jgi:hypothetical protein